MRLFSLLLCAVPAFALATPPLAAKVADVVKSPKKFDGKTLLVGGKIAEFKQRTSRAGREYYVFKLVDGKAYLSGYGQGKAASGYKDGAKVKLTGKFAAEKKVGDRVYRNELQIERTGKPASAKS